MASSSVKVPD